MMARSMPSDALPRPANGEMHMRKTQMVSAVCLGLGMSMACPRRHRMPKPMATAVRLPTATAPQRLPLRRPTTRPIVSYLHNFPRDNVSLTLVGGAKQPLGDVQVGDVYDASIGMGLALSDRALISFGYDPRVSSARPGRTDARLPVRRVPSWAACWWAARTGSTTTPQLERGAEPRRHARHT